MSEHPTFQPQAAAVSGSLQAPFSGGIVPGASASQDVRRFYLWLLAAIITHGAVLTGFISSSPRQIGSPDGLDGAISISLVTEADLRGDATVADEAPGEPSPPPAMPAAPPAPSMPPPPEPAPQLRELTQPQPPASPPLKPAIAPDPPAPKPDAEPRAEPAPKEDVPLRGEQPATQKPAAPETPAKSQQAEAPAETKASPAAAKPVTPKEAKSKDAKAQETKMAKIHPAVPPAMQAAIPGGRGAGVERPAGITRSGENDAFARGVIRALQQTMPQLRDTRGRVKVRITLDKNGNLVSTQVLMPSNVAGLDQSVIFATRQTSFPLPPYKAVPADLVFVVTYIYK